jgi:tight adherence protein C
MIRSSEQMRQTAAKRAMPDVIELVIVGIRSGLSPTNAVLAASERAHPSLAEAFGEVRHRLQRGQRLADSLESLPTHIGDAASSFVDGLAAADRYGSPIEPLLDRLATDARDDRRREAERHARTLPVRLAFPLVVCTLPSFVLLAIVPALLAAIASLRDSTL